VITAIVPAAGLSTRMGGYVPKPLLPWGAGTVVEQVVATLLDAGIVDVLVVTGHRREALEAVLAPYPVRCVFNPAYASGEMLSSIQTGLRAVPADHTGALIALADQPQLRVAVVEQVLRIAGDDACQSVIIPSYQHRRGHPILLPRWTWQEVLELPHGETLRTVINRHAAAIHYLAVDTPTVLADVDTPEQYRDALDIHTP
jgi:molybdenum cofactor cytidylyltransferase